MRRKYKSKDKLATFAALERDVFSTDIKSLTNALQEIETFLDDLKVTKVDTLPRWNRTHAELNNKNMGYK